MNLNIRTPQTSLQELRQAFQALLKGLKNPGGVIDASNATAGNIGEYISSWTGATWLLYNFSGAFQDVSSVILSAGDWDISAIVNYQFPLATTVDSVEIGLGDTSGDNVSGMTFGDNRFNGLPPINSPNQPTLLSIPFWRKSFSGANQTVFLKARMNFTGSKPSFVGRISARRFR